MTQANLDEIKRKALPILKEAGVTRSSLFGSYARGENKATSDIDFLVELPNASLFDLADLQTKLEQVLSKKIDLLTFNSLYPLLKKRILTEQVQIL